MSEYWKSTPNYWCKFCKTFVRDTKLERQNHEATPKHQGNIQRSLRTLHKGTEREERDKQRAKDEVARLNGVVSGNASAPSQPSQKSTAPSSVASAPKQADPQERKRQIAQLASLGVAVPEEYRKEMAMAGEWQTFSQKRAKLQEAEEIKPDVHTIGVKRRKLGEDDDDEEERASEQHVPTGWGSKFKKYSAGDDEKVDLDALLKQSSPTAMPAGADKHERPEIKEEDKEGDTEELKTISTEVNSGGIAPPSLKEEASDEFAPIVFKKRKHKGKVP